MGPDDDAIEIDLTEELSDDTIQSLFDAFDTEDWVAVDAVLDGIEPDLYETAEAKAGGADKNRGGAEKLRRYWTRGPGGAKIAWGTDGDWTRCVSHLSKYLGPRAKGYCSLRHKEMNGFYPGDKKNKSDEGLTMSMEFKAVGVSGMTVADHDEGIVETIVSVTGVVDNVKDKILPGAYAKTLATRKPKGVWSHDWDTPVSKTLDVKELMPGDSLLPKKMPDGRPWPREAGALLIKTQFNLETQRGREAYSDVRFHGDEQQWSIGYNVPVGGAKVDSKTGVREISHLELYEYSPVLFGAMPLARTTSVKEAQMAYKALSKGAAAGWLSESTDEDAVVEDEVKGEYAPVSFDDEFSDDERELSAEQMILVKNAIATLSDLLAAVEGVETKSDDKDKDDEGEEAEAEDEDADDENEDYGSLADAISDVVDEGDVQAELLKAAKAVDAALAEDDADALEKGVTAFLDVVEAKMGGDADEQLKTVSEILGDLVDQVAEAEAEPVNEDTVEVKEDDEELESEGDAPTEEPVELEGEAVAAEGKSILNVDEMKSLLDSLNE